MWLTVMSVHVCLRLAQNQSELSQPAWELHTAQFFNKARRDLISRLAVPQHTRCTGAPRVDATHLRETGQQANVSNSPDCRNCVETLTATYQAVWDEPHETLTTGLPYRAATRFGMAVFFSPPPRPSWCIELLPLIEPGPQPPSVKQIIAPGELRVVPSVELAIIGDGSHVIGPSRN